MKMSAFSFLWVLKVGHGEKYNATNFPWSCDFIHKGHEKMAQTIVLLNVKKKKTKQNQQQKTPKQTNKKTDLNIFLLEMLQYLI